MSYGPAWERLNAAVLELATGKGAPRDRLAVAVQHDLCRIRPEHEIPDPELRSWFARLMSRVCGLREIGGDNRVITLRRLTDSEVDEILIDIVSFYDEVTRQEAVPQRRRRAAGAA